MNELIKITESNGKKAVSARDLYLFLSIDDGSHFADWGKRNIEDMFFQYADFQILRYVSENGGRPGIDYSLSLDCAKEVAMMSRCEKGKQARLYFIEMEKVAINIVKLPDFNNPVVAARAWADALEQTQISQAKVLELQPKAEVYDKISDATNLLTMNDAAKTLKYGRNTLMKLLRDMLILRANNTPYQSYIDSGYFEVKIKPITNDSNYCQTFVTGKGLAWLSKKLTVLN